MDFEQACDEVDAIQDVRDLDSRIAALQQRAGELAIGEDGRAAFLAALASELQLKGDVDQARATYLAAIDDGGPTVLELRCGLLSVELESGSEDRVKQLLSELLALSRADMLVEVEYEWIADSLEYADRLREAMRWYTIPMRDIDAEDIDLLPIGLLHGRWRVRRELGLPPDAYDEARELLMSLT